MSRVNMPVLVRLLMCAALFGVLGTARPSDWSHTQNETSFSIGKLPIRSSFSGYIIAVG
jgi:hypothetical protein